MKVTVHDSLTFEVLASGLGFTEGPVVIEVPASVLEASLEAFLAEKAAKITGQ